MNFPLISICIPTYNGEKYLQEALDSVKRQTYKNIEVIISDDNSKDNTLQICERFKAEVDFPVFVLNHIPAGIGANWNNSIKNANGDYIKFLFQDDVLEDNCLEIMINILLTQKLQIVICKRNIISNFRNLKESSDWILNYGDLQKGINLIFRDFHLFKRECLNLIGEKYSLSYNFIGEPVTALFSKKIFNEVGEFSTELKQILDLEYWLRVLEKYPIGLINKKLIRFRIHDEQTSSLNSISAVNESEIIDEILLQKHFKFLNREQKKYLLYKKYPILKKIIKKLYRLKLR